MWKIDPFTEWCMAAFIAAVALSMLGWAYAYLEEPQPPARWYQVTARRVLLALFAGSLGMSCYLSQWVR